MSNDTIVPVDSGTASTPTAPAPEAPGAEHLARTAALGRSLAAAMSSGDVTAAGALLAPDVVRHFPGTDHPLAGGHVGAGGAAAFAQLAAADGPVNRALPAAELDEFVDTLAKRIATLRPYVVAETKKAVSAAHAPITVEGLGVENELLSGLFTADAAELAHRLLAAGAQTRRGERDLERILNSI